MRGSSQAVDLALFHQPLQQALAHDGVFEPEPRELDLGWMEVDADVIEHPVVEGAVVLEFQGAQRVRDAFQGIADAMREVVGGVDYPSIAGALMRRVPNAVQHRVAHVDIGEAMSILARSTWAPSGNSPWRIRSSRSRFSATGRSR